MRATAQVGKASIKMTQRIKRATAQVAFSILCVIVVNLPGQGKGIFWRLSQVRFGHCDSTLFFTFIL